MKFEIRDRWNKDIRFTVEAESFRSAVELALISGLNLRGADLADADLCVANLRDADLRDADLHDADLRGADLSGANLQDADLAGANLRDAILGEHRIISIPGHKDDLVYVDGILQIGCDHHTIPEWRERYRDLEKDGYSARDVEIYKLHIEHIAAVVAALWQEETRQDN